MCLLWHHFTKSVFCFIISWWCRQKFDLYCFAASGLCAHERICLWLSSDFSSVMLCSYCYNDRTWPLHSQCSDLFVSDLYGGALYLLTDTQNFYATLEACPKRALRRSSPAETRFSNGWERGSEKQRNKAVCLGDLLRQGHLPDHFLICFFMPSSHKISFDIFQINWNSISGNLSNWSYQILPLCVCNNTYILYKIFNSSNRFFINDINTSMLKRDINTHVPRSCASEWCSTLYETASMIISD